MYYRQIFLSAVLLAITVFTFSIWSPYILSTVSWPSPSQSPLQAGSSQSQSPNDATTLLSHGKNRRPKTDHLTLRANMPHEYLPTAHNQRRLIVIGDIHGMNTELGHLLDKARYDSTRDHVVTLGDMVNKGHDSKGVLARLMAMNASAVRGNHEDRLLLALEEYHNRAALDQHGDSNSGEDGNDRPNIEKMRKKDKKILKVAKSLTAKQVRWLSHLPVILEAKPLQLYFVHAGLVPGVRLDEQDPWAVMNMRSLVYPQAQDELRRKTQNTSNSTALPDQEQDPLSGVEEKPQKDHNDDDDDDVEDTSHVIAVPLDDHSGEQWTKAWDRYTKHLPKSSRRTVMYGHDARRGFTEGKFTVGLDSGCVRGGSLTALIVQVGAGHEPFRYTKIHVPCKKFA
ncbi:hypothetical protein E4U17_007742 [Claviceps sp. LM77 group G4]|nr:hypothetical protein E4U17_007742 [Claviceps sp. LM77 group G4]KAG6085181.1 hypothetical protein E4U16_007397 [Claviceps sp. LM84 group G4]KAG6085523.1 hypothetical protein E4U33_001611 [Claviceps sp. LM78 group G4]